MACYALRSCESGSTDVFYTTDAPTVAPYADTGNGVLLSLPSIPLTGCFTIETVTGPSPCCPAPIEVIVVDPGDPFCTCTTEYVCYTLTDCLGVYPTIYTFANLNPYVGTTVSVGDYPGVCWNVTGNTFLGDCPVTVAVTCVLPCVCTPPGNCYTLTLCDNPLVTIDVNYALTLTVGDVVQPSPEPAHDPGTSNCWTVTDEIPCTVGLDVITSVVNYGPDGCVECGLPPVCYRLQSCDNSVNLYTNSDFSTFVNQYISLTAYPGECFYVSIIGECIEPIVLDPESASPCSCGCYTLTECTGAILPFNTTSNLSTYIADTIYLAEYGGCEGPCFEVQVAIPPCIAPVAVTPVTCTVPCEPCTQETCYELVDCVTGETYITLTNPTANGVDLSLLVGQTISTICVEDQTDCVYGCWRVQGVGDCGVAVPRYVYDIYSNCTECADKCYNLIRCSTGLVAATIKETGPNPNGLPALSTLVGQTLVDVTFDTIAFAGCYVLVRNTDIECYPSINYDRAVSFSVSDTFCCQPTCYLVTACDGTVPPFVVTNDLSAYVGKTIKACSVVAPGGVTVCRCYTVSVSQTCEDSTNFSEVFAAFDTCEECNYCNCPDGYTKVGDQCQKITSSDATLTNTVYTVEPGDKSISYGSGGTNFYDDISNLPLPITENGSSQFEDASTSVLTFGNIATGVWGPGFLTSRLNTCGVWTTVAPNPLNQWIGFSHCVTLTEATVHCIGIAADNNFRFSIDGTLVVEASNALAFNSNIWHVFNIEIPAGTHVITVEGMNTGSDASFGAEIYNVDSATLQGYTTVLEVSTSTIFSTFDNDGSIFTVGDTSGYSCPVGYIYNNCNSDNLCSVIQTTPYNPCPPVYKVSDCNGVQPDFYTDTDLSAYAGLAHKLCIEEPSYSTDFYILRDCAGNYPDIKVTYNLSAYNWQSVTLQEYPNVCFIIIPIPVGVPLPGPYQTPTIVGITECCDIQLTWPDGCYCASVELVTRVPSIPFYGYDFQEQFACCADCTRQCYTLTDCQGALQPINVCNDFANYVGQIIKVTGCGDTCWIVSAAAECGTFYYVEGTVTVYGTCTACLPVVPEPVVDLHPRRIKPGYYSPVSCVSTDYIERVNCTFAKQVYDEMIINRYGITVCCDHDVDRWDIKKSYLDYQLLQDPSLCKSTLCYCPEPCFVSAVITVQEPTCPSPFVIDTEITVPCDAPVLTGTTITVSADCNCTCYNVTPDTTDTIFYIDCTCTGRSEPVLSGGTIAFCAKLPPVSYNSTLTITAIGDCSGPCKVINP